MCRFSWIFISSRVPVLESYLLSRLYTLFPKKKCYNEVQRAKPYTQKKCSRWSLSATSSVYGFFPRYESAVNLAFDLTQGKALLLGIFLDLKAGWKGLFFFLCVSPIRVFFDNGIIGTRPSVRLCRFEWSGFKGFPSCADLSGSSLRAEWFFAISSLCLLAWPYF